MGSPTSVTPKNTSALSSLFKSIKTPRKTGFVLDYFGKTTYISKTYAVYYPFKYGVCLIHQVFSPIAITVHAPFPTV
jgi:hypothetical protein